MHPIEYYCDNEVTIREYNGAWVIKKGNVFWSGFSWGDYSAMNIKLAKEYSKPEEAYKDWQNIILRH